ncbi:peroxisomal multifunctional enzyme type 2 domain protein [Mycobacterium kansasii]|uniref:Peroxisomal multifunctional enzyme type 2 domain protein n=1 Tax=Mycobacterium kansasii TaxID=1768 RepID=A0A1V3WK99_MYCKA|nr:peroxisomal multifunctional enzyme type 2 domain protein [Mycobacterium kansasii]
MAIDPGAVGAVTEPMLFEWTDRETLLYALGVGAGTEDLSFTTENSHGIAQQVLPTYAVICCPAFGAAARWESSTGPGCYTARRPCGCMRRCRQPESCRWSPKSPTSRTRVKARTPSSCCAAVVATRTAARWSPKH